MFEGAATAKLEREAANAVASAAASGYITFLWESGKRKLWGEGPALQKMAVATYLALSQNQEKGFLTLSIPVDMLDPDVLSKFQTQFKESK